MGLSFYNLKKWTKMVLGRSVLHVKQDMGKIIDKNKIFGYYNDLTLKVLNQEGWREEKYLPRIKTDKNEGIEFPIAIFQYALGCWDLYLITKEAIYIKKFDFLLDWILENQEESGAWDTFSYINKEKPYSAMAQAEGASVLIRAYEYYKDNKYKNAAIKAINFMLLPEEEGGTTKYAGNEIYFQELIGSPTVLNGHIFSLFGLYDLMLVTNDKKYKTIFDRACQTLKSNIKLFKRKYWTNYNIDGSAIASPFYHKLHIAQFKALYLITEDSFYKNQSIVFEKQKNNILYKTLAFIIKAYQKVFK